MPEGLPFLGFQPPDPAQMQQGNQQMLNYMQRNQQIQQQMALEQWRAQEQARQQMVQSIAGPLGQAVPNFFAQRQKQEGIEGQRDFSREQATTAFGREKELLGIRGEQATKKFGVGSAAANEIKLQKAISADVARTNKMLTTKVPKQVFMGPLRDEKQAVLNEMASWEEGGLIFNIPNKPESGVSSRALAAVIARRHETAALGAPRTPLPTARKQPKVKVDVGDVDIIPDNKKDFDFSRLWGG